MALRQHTEEVKEKINDTAAVTLNGNHQLLLSELEMNGKNINGCGSGRGWFSCSLSHVDGFILVLVVCGGCGYYLMTLLLSRPIAKLYKFTCK